MSAPEPLEPARLPSDWDAWADAIRSTARLEGWSVEGQPEGLWWLHRRGTADRPVLYVSAGIHGDEPAGPLACASLLRARLLPDDWTLWMFPLLNPRGVRQGTRENPEGIDLNRDYHLRQTAEASRHLEVLAGLGRFSAAICLHEDWEATGCYLYEVHPGHPPEAARRVLQAMGRHLPPEPSALIDGRPADQGLIRRQQHEFEGDLWPEAIYLARTHTALCYTLETPSSREIARRVDAHVAGVLAVVRELEAGPAA